MKKIMILLLLLPNISWAAPPISAQDLPTVIKDINTLLTDAHAMLDFAIQAQQTSNAGYTFTVPGSNEKVQMTPQQQADMFSSYAQLKAAIQADLTAMP